jgi:glycosyltransferase involved in cell wall biosynthesis
MACGTPGIGTNVGSLPEVVIDGTTGYIVPPGDPEALRGRIEAFRSDPSRVERMGRQARQVVLERFTWPVVVARCLAAYEQPALLKDAPEVAARVNG